MSYLRYLFSYILTDFGKRENALHFFHSFVKNGGKISISNLVNTEGSDYERVYKCCDFFAKQGEETTILPRFNSPLKNDLYKRIFAELEGTPYWGKCPDFKVGDKFYEHRNIEALKNHCPI